MGGWGGGGGALDAFRILYLACFLYKFLDCCACIVISGGCLRRVSKCILELGPELPLNNPFLPFFTRVNDLVFNLTEGQICLHLRVF